MLSVSIDTLTIPVYFGSMEEYAAQSRQRSGIVQNATTQSTRQSNDSQVVASMADGEESWGVPQLPAQSELRSQAQQLHFRSKSTIH